MTSGDPSSVITFIAGPAILTNACAILQNGATTRYNLAITQWREFIASVAAAGHDGLSLVYVDPQRALALAERRVRLQLRVLDLLNVATALFATTAVVGLGAPFLVQAEILVAEPLGALMMTAGGTALLFLLAAVTAIFLESACGRGMLRLQARVRRQDGACWPGSSRAPISSPADQPSQQ